MLRYVRKVRVMLGERYGSAKVMLGERYGLRIDEK